MPNLRWKYGSLITFVLFCNLFFFQAIGSFGLSLLLLGLLLFILAIFWNKSAFTKFLPAIAIFTGFELFLFLSIASRAQGFVQFGLIVSSFAIGALLVYLLASSQTFVRSFLELFETPIKLGLGYLQNATQVRIKFPELGQRNYPWLKTIKPMATGLLISIPILIILINLFSSADPIYGSYVKKIFTIDLEWFFSERIVLRAIISLALVAFFLPFLGLKITQSIPFLSRMVYGKTRELTQEMTIVMSLVAVTLASFLVIQWQYIFVSVPKETDLHQFGVKTYSEYVQRGFFELILISLVLYALIWIGLVTIRIAGERKGALLRWVQILVLGEFGIFVLSIFRRIYLYQLHHGWSLVRLYGGFFLLGITFFAITLLLRHFYEKRWVIVEGVGVLVLLTLFSLFNAEHFIATTHPPTVNNRIDFVYLSRMSADGTAGWQQAYTYANEILAKDYQGKINHDDRRSIFYAGVIINELLAQHDRLIKRYANESEWLAYKKAVLTEFSNEHRLVVNELMASVSAERMTLVPDYGKTTTSTVLETALEFQKKLDEGLMNFPEKQPDHKQTYIFLTINAPVYPQFGVAPCALPDILLTFTSGPIYYPYSPNYAHACERSFYRFNEAKITDIYETGLDKLFRINFSDQNAYLILREQIPVDQLLQLSHRYFSLRQQILTQPDGERSVDVDVSFTTPFL